MMVNNAMEIQVIENQEIEKQVTENQERIPTDDLTLNRPDVLAEVKKQFYRYEAALVSNDVAVLDSLFHQAPETVRYGATEHLYGYAEIQAFRKARSPKGLARTLQQTQITTYGERFAIAYTLFVREGQPRIGRQSQTWVRFAEGWKIVAAHVSWEDPVSEPH